MVEQGIIRLNIDGKHVEARQGQTILEVVRTPKIRRPQRRNPLAISARQLTDIGFKKKTAILQCWWCWGKVHYDLTWEKRASLGSGNVPWIASHIIKKLNLVNNEASFASLGLMRRVVTISISQLKGA
jgi:hypothetical protein